MADKRKADSEDPRDDTKFRKMNTAEESVEPLFFTILVSIICNIGTSLYRNVLRKRLSNVDNIGQQILSKKQRLLNSLNTKQKSILFPEKGTYNGDLNDLDMDTIYVLLQELGNIKPHSNGWGALPNEDDRSISANIDRVELLRRSEVEKYSHTIITEDEFKRMYRTLVHAMADLGANIQKLHDVLRLLKVRETKRKARMPTTQVSSKNQSNMNTNVNAQALRQQEHNYLRIMGLTLYIGTAVFRKTVENRYPFEISFGDLFQRLRFRLEKKLDKTSQKILYPKGGNYTGDLSDLAMTTLYSILRFACNIPPHREGWGKRPLDDDRCLSANIERIRIMRNELMHRANAEMNEQEYQNKFRILKRTLLDLGANEEDINAITLIPDDPHFAFGHSRKTRPNQRADESMKFWKKSSMHRKEWFFNLSIVCDGFEVHCIIDIRLQPIYNTLEVITKKRELGILSGRPLGVCKQMFDTDQVDIQRFWRECKYDYDYLDKTHPEKCWTVLQSNIEFEKLFFFYKNTHSSDSEVQCELQYSVESNFVLLCRYILIKSNSNVILPLLGEVLDTAINTQRRDMIKVVTSRIIKGFFQKHKEWLNKETSIWIGVECTCDATKDKGYEDCVCSSSKPMIFIERYQSTFEDSTIDERFSSFSTKIIDLIEPQSTEASVVANQILETSETQLIEGNIPGKIAKVLFKEHSNLSIIYPSSMRSKGFRTPGFHKLEKLNCINLVCKMKGVIPVGETHFPLEIEGLRTDVLQGTTHLLGTLRIGDVVENMNTRSNGTLGGFVKYYGLNAFLTCAHVVFGNEYVHSVTKEEIHHANCHMMSGINSSGPTECILIRHVFKHDNTNPSETSIDAALAVIKNGDISMFNIAEDGLGCLTCTDLGLETPYLNHNAIDPIILRDARAFCGVSGNQKGVATAGRESRVLIRTPAHIQSGKITMFNQLCLHGMRFKPGDSGTCVYVYTPGNFNRPTGCIGMLIGESTCNHSILTPMTEILKVFDL